MREIDLEVAQRVRRFHHSEGVTQEQLAVLGVTYQQV